MNFSMATLTETAYYTRSIIKYGLLSLVSLVVLRGAFIVSVRLYRRIFPPPPPPPSVRFGQLPRPPLTSVENLPETITYNLETPDGTTSIQNDSETTRTKDQARVYFMPQSSPNLLGLPRAKEKAAALGFKTEPELLENSIYRFRHENQQLTLDVHSTSGSFHLYYSWQGNQSLPGNPPSSDKEAEDTVKNLLTSAALLPKDIIEGDSTYEYFKVNGTGLSPTNSLSEADVVKVKLNRKDLDGLSVYSQNPDEAPIWGIVSKAAQVPNQIMELSYRYFPVEYEEYSTYPIKSSTEAWKELGEGKGFIVKLGENKDGNITIRRIFLGYLDVLDIPVKFMQPVFVFEGDNDFVAYLLAVPDQYLSP